MPRPNPPSSRLSAIEIWEHALGVAHPDVAECLMNYAAVL